MHSLEDGKRKIGKSQFATSLLSTFRVKTPYLSSLILGKIVVFFNDLHTESELYKQIKKN